MIIKTDFLIIGSGISGLLLALELSSSGQVVLVTKNRPTEANSKYAQGGIAAVVNNEQDSFAKHIKDTITAGDSLNPPEVVEEIISNGPQAIAALEKYNTLFEKENGDFRRTREGGHSERRVLFHSDATGSEIEHKLYNEVKNNPQIIILTDHYAVDLIMEHKLSTMQSTEQTCWGAFVLDKNNNEIISVGAKKTFLATGGAGKIYLYTSNPDIATGDGIAMAYRAGATIENMEFMQFHPTTLYHPYAKNFLISEAVRGEGGILKDINGEPFMDRFHPLKSLAPRDIVSRSIDTIMKEEGSDHVFLDISFKSKDFLENRFPNISEKCKTFNVDLTKDMIPVVPAAHFLCGGIKTNIKGESEINNLYALGECACTGFHGANRLASNSLLEGAVMAVKISQDVKKMNLKNTKIPELDNWTEPITGRHEEIIITHNWDELRRTMWNFVGIVRSNNRLKSALKRIELIEEEISDFYHNNPLSTNLLEMRNLLINAKITVHAAMWRKESRGIHYTLDYPEKSKEYENKFSAFNKEMLKKNKNQF